MWRTKRWHRKESLDRKMEELLKEALHEITTYPNIFLAEVVQFTLFLGVIVCAGRRFMGKKLKERQETIAVALKEADKTEREYAELKKEAEAIVASATEEVRQMIKTAKTKAKKELQTALRQADEEAKEIILRAGEMVKAEKERVISETSEHLVNLIAETTRRYVDEALTEGERRELTQKIILASLEEMESVSLR